MGQQVFSLNAKELKSIQGTLGWSALRILFQSIKLIRGRGDRQHQEEAQHGKNTGQRAVGRSDDLSKKARQVFKNVNIFKHLQQFLRFDCTF